MDFFVDHAVLFALLAAAAAVVYGLSTTRWLLAKSPGNERMQEISAAAGTSVSSHGPTGVLASNILPCSHCLPRFWKSRAVTR